MKITALASWYGSNRMLAKNVGKMLEGCSHVSIPFAGGMSELPHIKARTMLVSDLHRHVITLANVVRDDRVALQERLDSLLFHPDVLEAAQNACKLRESGKMEKDCPLWWATDYFVTAWMARNGTAGTDGEFDAGMSIRWEAGGGDSVVRFRNATESLKEWETIAKRCTFVCMDVFDLLPKVKDDPENGVYCDCPWVDDGDGYTHKFTIEDQRRLASELAKFKHARVVVRFGDHPLVRELYPEDLWEWNLLDGRTSANKKKREVLLVNRRS